jgi:NTP pyrophosphatase (non-canonical NTP hydrolase)
VFNFDQFSFLNARRALRWHSDGVEWTLGDWGNALAGEAGEACNVIKKIRRVQTGALGRDSEQDVEEMKLKLAAELADVVIYADLIATQIGVRLDEAVANKFNQVSIEYGFPERL